MNSRLIAIDISVRFCEGKNLNQGDSDLSSSTAFQEPSVEQSVGLDGHPFRQKIKRPFRASREMLSETMSNNNHLCCDQS